MAETLELLLKISLIVFMAGNLFDMGLRLRFEEALRGLRDARFVSYSLLWSFVLVPALAYVLVRVIPLHPGYAMGLVLLGMAPCAPFLPVMVDRARGDMGYAAAFLILASVGTALYMPIMVPVLVEGLSVSAWTIAKPLLVLVLLPLAIGGVIRRRFPAVAGKLHPFVKKTTGVFTLAMLVLCAVVYGEGFLDSAGSFAAGTQLLFLTIIAAAPFLLSVGLGRPRRVVLSLGVTTRNLGAALAPLFAVSSVDERAIIMIVLGVPLQVLVAAAAAGLYARGTPEPSSAAPQAPEGEGVQR